MDSPLLNLSFVCLDTETTGLGDDAEIVEVGLVKVIDGQIVERYSQLLEPDGSVPELVTQITGIDNAMLKGQPRFAQIADTVLDFIGDFTMVAHNVDFDRRLLERQLGRVLPNAWIDTHDMAKIFLPTLTSYKLVAIAGALHIDNHTYHRALGDADCTAQVLLKLTEKACQLDPFLLQKIYALFANEDCGLTVLLRAILTEATSHGEIGKVYATEPEPTHHYGKQPLLHFAQAQDFFAPDGLMAKASGSYQHRPQQIEMQRVISEAFANETHGIVEAGTGTGKSFAYLLPALLWSYENDKRVLVSTNTIALQEQLYNKDIPFLKACLDFDFPVALSKGRGNYICQHRFDQHLSQAANGSWSDKLFVAGLLYWLTFTKQGDRETLNLNKLENQLWSNVCSQTETCINSQCPWYHRCYYLTNRRACENSMLIITNHALLLQNLKLDNQLLPAFDYVIVDEAHNLEDEATRQFTDTVDLDYLRRDAQKLLRNNSALSRIIKKAKEQLDTTLYDRLEAIQTDLKSDINVLDVACKDAIAFIFTVGPLSRNNEWRITAKERKASWWEPFSDLLRQVLSMIHTIHDRLAQICHQADTAEDLEQLVRELTFNQNWYAQQQHTLETFLDEKQKNDIYWIDYTQNSWGSNLTLSIAPIDVMPLLKEKLFDNKLSVILTSATLAIANNLKYTAELYLLQADEYLSYITPSPFDYQKQSCIAIPTDIADYSQVSEERYSAMLIDSLEKIVQSVTGGVLVLFTSYAMLNKTYFKLKYLPSMQRYNILAHGQDGNRTSILQSLNQSDNTIVLGANSFWEGVDIKGAGLTTLVITKLPFQPPTRPIASAKMEYLQAQGKNSFSNYSLPQAVLKFRQGCGRLIRSSNDWGSIIILDKRVLSKAYGKEFLRSLPQQPILRKPLHEICNTLHDWMQHKAKQ